MTELAEIVEKKIRSCWVLDEPSKSPHQTVAPNDEWRLRVRLRHDCDSDGRGGGKHGGVVTEIKGRYGERVVERKGLRNFWVLSR
ncbi:hypothetical protein V6N13_109115 [Hibiscus sabdariffa]